MPTEDLCGRHWGPGPKIGIGCSFSMKTFINTYFEPIRIKNTRFWSNKRFSDPFSPPWASQEHSRLMFQLSFCNCLFEVYFNVSCVVLCLKISQLWKITTQFLHKKTTLTNLTSHLRSQHPRLTTHQLPNAFFCTYSHFIWLLFKIFTTYTWLTLRVWTCKTHTIFHLHQCLFHALVVSTYHTETYTRLKHDTRRTIWPYTTNATCFAPYTVIFYRTFRQYFYFKPTKLLRSLYYRLVEYRE